VWYPGLCKPLKCKLQTAQNKMIRFVLNTGNRFHLSYDSFRKLQWLSVQKRMDYLTLSSMYNVYYHCAPSYMLSQFNRLSNQHHYGTRNVNWNFSVPNVKTQGHNSFKFNGIKLWNNLAEVMRSCRKSKDLFKIKCKKHLLIEMKNEQDCEFVC
jgi:hypothetical protein